MPHTLLEKLTQHLRQTRSVLEFACLPGRDAEPLRVFVVCEEPLPRLRRQLAAVLELPEWPQPPVWIPVTRLPRDAHGQLDPVALAALPEVSERERALLQEQLSAVLGPDTVWVSRQTPEAVRLHLADLNEHWTRQTTAVVTPTDAVARQQRDSHSQRPALVEGPPLNIDSSTPLVLSAYLARAAASSKGIRFLDMQGRETQMSYAELQVQAQRVQSGLLARGFKAGDTAIFQIEDNTLYLQTFWGCVLAGVAPLGIAVAADYRQKNAAVTKFYNIWAMLKRPKVLAEQRLLDALRQIPNLFDDGSTLEAMAVEPLPENPPATQAHVAQPTDTALYLLTSGSTGTPKAVVQTHGNLIRRSLGFLQTMDFGPDEVSFNWLPIDHVTGIVMCHLRDVVALWDQVHCPTQRVLHAPLLWLDGLHRYRASISWAPNFAFRLINDQEQALAGGSWDLSQVRFLENAGEPIVARTCRRFVQLLAPFGLRPDVIAPAWGMAETCSTVTVSRRFNLELTSDSDPFTDLGIPFPGFAMRIVNDKDEIVPERVVGEFQCKGLSVLPGYFDNPAANAASYTQDGFFRTGDLAFIEDGRLTLTGRAKDVIIINGMNYYGHEIESALDLVPGISVSFTAAVAIRLPGSDTDSLAIFFHTELTQRADLLDLFDRVRAKALEFGVAPTYLIPVAKTDIPKTGIGKIQRSHLQKRFAEGGFEQQLRAVDALLENEHTLPHWFFQRRYVPKAAEPGRNPAGRVVVFTDQLGLGAALCQALHERGQNCVRVDADSRFAKLGPAWFTLDPLDGAGYAQLWAALAQPESGRDHLIFMGGYSERTAAPTREGALLALNQGPYALTVLLRSLAAQPRFQLSVVVNDAAPVGSFCGEKGATAAFLAAAQRDFAEADLRLIDLETGAMATNLALLLGELDQALGDREVCYRSGQRLVPRLERSEILNTRQEPLALPEAGLVLITGGLGALGQALARHLHAQTKVGLLLLGRPSAEDLSPRLASLRAEGISCWAAGVDLEDGDALRAAVAQVEAESGRKLAGIFHLAGALVREEPWSEAALEHRFEGGFAAKTLGCASLCALLEGRKDLPFVAFSSVYGVFGGSSLSGYAAANGFLSTWTAWYRQAGYRFYTLAWSAWEGLGLAADLSPMLQQSMHNQGFFLIERQHGLSSLDVCLALPPEEHIVGLDTTQAALRPYLLEPVGPLETLRAWVATDREDPRWSALARCQVSDRFGQPLDFELRPAPLRFRQQGKLDRKGLEQHGQAEEGGAPAPLDGLESQLAEIWRTVLGLEHRPSAQRTFFDLGGNSVLANQVQAAIARQFNQNIDILDLFRFPTVRGLAKLLRGEAAQPTKDPAWQERRTNSGPIAVIGLACRVPGASDLDSFWANLVAGVDSIHPLEVADIAAAGVDAALYTHPDYVARSPYLAEAECFDAAFFGYSPAEALVMDPQQRIFLETSWHCLEHAAVVPERYPGRIGVFAGSLLSTHLLFDVVPRSGYVQPEERIRNLIGNATDNLAMRVSYKLDLRGPSFSVQTNCSTGLVAIHVACSQLREGHCDLALAGGVAARTPQKTGYLFLEGSLSSPDGCCRPFDHRAAGTLFGDGVAVVALKRLSEAVAEGDPILAVVRGTAINNDGAQKVGFSAPSIQGQQAVIEAALAVAGVDPASISYVEAHGTATKVGDPIEVRALSQAFGSVRPQSCALGSVKSNIGHLETAAGAVGFIKTVLALANRTLPPTLHFEKPNPLIDFANSPFYVQRELSAWTGPSPLRAGVSSFGIGGTNAHAVLEEAPARSVAAAACAPGRYQLFPLSAKDPQALEALALRLADWLERHEDVSLADVAFTLQTGRTAFPLRRAVVAAERSELIQLLREGGGCSGTVDPDLERSLVFLFPGGGSQYVQMGRDLWTHEPVFRAALERCAAILAPHLDLKGILFPEPDQEGVAQGLLGEIKIMLPVIVSLEYALAQLLADWGLSAEALIGHSLGEYTAAILAGVFSLEDGLAIVSRRAELMQSMPSGAMLVVSLSEAELRPELDENLSLAVINARRTCVVSGSPSAIADLEARLSRRGCDQRRVHIATAAHSHLLDPILPEFRAFLETFQMNPPQLPYISNTTGTWVTAAQATDPVAWTAHLRQTVHFADGLGVLLEQPDRIFIEVGPGHTLSGLVGRHEARLPSHAVVTTVRHASASETDHQFLLQNIAILWCLGQNPNWARLHPQPSPTRIHLPGYPFLRTVYAYTDTPPIQTAARKTSAQAVGPHPFLDVPFHSSLSPQVSHWESELNLVRHAFLRDHRVYDETLFPAAGYVECAAAAAQARYGHTNLVFTELRFDKTLFLSEQSGSHIQITLEGRDEDGLSFQFASRQRQTHPDVLWERHCHGRVRPETRLNLEPVAAIDPEALAQGCADTLTATEFYQDAAARGIHYGPAFQGLSHIQLGKGRALCRLEPHPQLDLGAYCLHPAVLDLCFQAALATLPRPIHSAPDHEPRPFFPVGLDQLRLLGPFSSARWVWVTYETSSDDPDTLRSNLLIADAEDTPLVEIRGFQLHRIAEHHEVKIDDLFYQTVWRPQALGMTSGSGNPLAGRVLIVGDRGSVGQELAGLLTELGGTPCLVRPPEMQALASDPSDSPNAVSDAWRAVFAPVLEDPAPISALVFLPALDVDPEAPPLATLPQSCLALLPLAQNLLQSERTPLPRLWIVTRQVHATDGGLNANAAMIWGMATSLHQEIPALLTTCLDLDAPFSDVQAAEVLLDELRFNRDETQVHRGPGLRRVARLEHLGLADVERAPQPVAGQPFAVEAPSTGLLDDLGLRLVAPPPSPGPHELTLAVSHWGINFRDVLLAMGLLPAFEENQPSWVGELVGTVTAVGSEVTRFAVGDRVCAFQPGPAATYVNVASYRAMHQPPGLTAEEAATVMITYLTAWYGLVHLGRLKRGERVLIHSAAGGVGIAAVRIAQYLGAEVFATAGSTEKQAFLHSLGVTRLYNSRTLDFAERIRAHTDGEGVDVVLSALTGDAVAKNFQVLAPFGRYLEMGTRSIIGNHDPSLRPHDRDISYILFSLKRFAELKPSAFEALCAEVEPLLHDPHFGPLPHLTFPVSQVAEAFHHLNRSKHIGKVVLAFDDPQALAKPPHFSQAFQMNGTYLVTGGLSGLGLAFAEWLAAHGAGALALVGRRAPSAHALAVIQGLRAAGCRVEVFRGDIGAAADVAAMLERLRAEMPPLRGVFHAAAVLADATLDRLDASAFQTSHHAKVQGAYLLDQMTASDPLDLFVCFSSIVSVLGNPGQANYSAANAYLDTLAQRRVQRNQPALTLNWGSWARIGLAAAAAIRGSRLARHGLGNLEPEQGLQAMGALLHTPHPQLVVADFQPERWVEAFPGARSAALLRGLFHASSSKTLSFRETLLEAAPLTRLEILQNKIGGHIAKALGLSQLPVDQPLNTLGLDSLMSIELRNRVEADLGIRVKLVSFIKGLSLARLSKDLLGDLLQQAEPDASAPPSLEGSHSENVLPPIMRHPVPLPLWPLSHSQEMCLHFLNRGGLPYVNAPLCFRIQGPLDLARLKEVFVLFGSRHPIFRTRLTADLRQQEEVAQVDFPIDFEDLRGLPDGEEIVENWFAKAAGEDFDLTVAPPLRINVFQFGPQLFELFVIAPHTVLDGWSIDLFQQEFGLLYTALESRTQPPEPPAVTYADYAVWERHWMTGPVLERHRAWWRQALEGVPPYLELPTDFPRTRERRQRLAHHTSILPDALYQHLGRLAQAEETTPYTLLMSAFVKMLAAWTGKDDIVVGTSHANRFAPETVNLIGCFFSPQPLRIRCDRAATFRALWQQVISTSEQVQAHAGCPYTEVVAIGHPQPAEGYEPLINVHFAMQAFDFFTPFPLGNAATAQLHLPPVPTSPHDLHLMVFPKSQDGVVLVWDYHHELFQDETIARLAQTLEETLRQITPETLDQPIN